ncbi:hypothetical protein AAG570_001287 [Ranatra chinensis]|uniref:C2H2-type domain-containing protein n=1 Tax=Ranatra chinensis TaxID=642074 RepID=A0ABD0YU06_9HEMI
MHIVQEERTMSRQGAFKRINYSHCPLKKRPVHVFLKEEDTIRNGSDDNSEPENLSTKPEDLSLACKSLTPPHGVAMISGSLKRESHQVQEVDTPSHPLLQHGHFLSKGSPLEPLSLNTPNELPTWGRHPTYYPQHYLPVNYPYPDVYHPYYPGSPPEKPMYPAGPGSPPHRFPPLPQPKCGLSPTSSTTSSLSYSGVYCGGLQPPPTPEDLSSPGTKRTKDQSSTSPRYQCTYCNKSYSTYSGLSKHQQFHCSANEDSAAKKTFSCKHCEKVYVSLGALKMHIRTHTLPCKCKLCGKAFSRPWLLQGHIRTHTGEKPFTCPHCNRAFADRSNLRAHLQTHSDVKKYSCPTCSKTFSRMSLLSKHCDGGCPGSLSSGGEDGLPSYPMEMVS